MPDNIEQNVNQAQAQSQEQEQEQQQGQGLPVVPGELIGAALAAQIAAASNQNVVVGNAGAVVTGPQTATAVNVADTGSTTS